MGLATRFTLLLGLCTGVLATVACWLLLSGAADLQKEGIEKARRVMAAETAELRSLGAEAPNSFDAKAWSEGKTRIQEGVVTLETREGPRTTRIFRAIPPGGDASKAIVLFSPELEEGGADPLLILVLLVGGILVLSTIGVGAMMAIRLVAPLKTMAEDVLAISRGHLDRRIEGKGAVGELAHLAKAVDRMVGDLLEGQETEEALVAKEQEEDDLRSIRRNLQPMTVDPPEGFFLSTHLEEAGGAGTGDFVDAMADAAGAPILVVGASAADGLPGALLLAMTRAYLRSAILNGEGPAEACVTTNASLNRDLARGLFASAMVARLDPATSEVELVSAGHKAPAVRWDSAAQELRRIQPNGIALGFDEGPVFLKSLEKTTFTLNPGDALFLFSPGAFSCEGAKGEALGEAGVYGLGKVAVEQGMDAMIKQLKAFLGGEPDTDLAFALLRREKA